MLRGLFRLAWLELKIFIREPLGVFGTVGIPVVIFLFLGRLFGMRAGRVPPDAPRVMSID